MVRLLSANDVLALLYESTMIDVKKRYQFLVTIKDLLEDPAAFVAWDLAFKNLSTWI